MVAGAVKSGVSNDNNAYPELDDYQYVNYAAQPLDYGQVYYEYQEQPSYYSGDSYSSYYGNDAQNVVYSYDENPNEGSYYDSYSESADIGSDRY